MQHTVISNPGDGAFKSIGFCVKQGLLAWDLARALDDPNGISLYRAYCQRYPEELLRKVLGEVKAVPAYAIKKGRGALFNYLMQQYAQETTKNPGR